MLAAFVEGFSIWMKDSHNASESAVTVNLPVLTSSTPPAGTIEIQNTE